ncbi:MAG TPA: phosphorylase [Casimicrobiaceae bacterium]
MSVIAVTGLAIEARIAAGAGVRTLVGGGNAQQLLVALERVIARGASAIMSFGIAGGLADGLVPGTWLVARTIVTATATWPVDAAWTRAIELRLVGALTADIAGVDALVDKLQEKHALRRTTGAAAVDTESHIAARIAAAHGLPFAAFRVIADPARRSLPPAVLVALRDEGKINYAAVLGSLGRSPGQFGSLARTALDARIAFRALSRGRRCLGPSLGFANVHELLLDVP